MAEQKGKHWNFTRLLTMGKENKHLDKKANQTEIPELKNSINEMKTLEGTGKRDHMLENIREFEERNLEMIK